MLSMIDATRRSASAHSSSEFASDKIERTDLGPWTGGPEGEVDRLRLPYRLLRVVWVSVSHTSTGNTLRRWTDVIIFSILRWRRCVQS